MKIVVIRHAPVQMRWEKSYSSEGFDEAMRKYDQSPVLSDAKEIPFPEERPVYVSSLQRTADTAKILFGDKDVTVSSLLDEVPLTSFMDTDKQYPLSVWNLMGRIQWFFGSARQTETRKDTKKRAKELVRLLQKRGEDCILISHGWFMGVLTGELKRAGYIARRSGLIRIAPLERIVFTEKALHCGNCAHNCLLTHPGCAIGKERAAAKGIH